MDRKRNYLVNDGYSVFNPLEMFGFHGLHPKAMQHSFVDLRVNTHSVDRDFSLFNYKDKESDANFKNNFLKHGGMELPLGNSISKLIGGFIGSKCLVGANRSSPFWGKVLQQYSILNQNLISTMKAKESATDYIKTNVVDAAVLISHSLDMICCEERPFKKEEAVSKELPSFPVHLNTCSEVKMNETGKPTPKQSYAEVAKSLTASKHTNSLSENLKMNRKRMRSDYRTASNMPRKKYNSDKMPQTIQLSHKSWRNRGEYSNQNKHHTHYVYTHKGSHSKEAPNSSDKTRKCISTTNSTKITNGVLKNHKINQDKSKQLHNQSNGRKMPLKRRANVNFLNDIKEDCENMIFESESTQKTGLTSPENNTSSSDLLNTYDPRSVPKQCMNWRCRPNKSLCDMCKMNSYLDSIPDPPVVHQETAVTCDADGYKIESEICVIATSENNSNFSTEVDPSVTDGKVAVAESATVMRTRLSSVCSVESEDSFIIMFDASVNCSDDDEASETTSNYSDSDTGNDDTEEISSDDESDDDDSSSISSQCSNLSYEDNCGNDEIDHAQGSSESETQIFDSGCVADDKLREANALWESAYENIPAEEKQSQKVQFAESQCLETVHPMLAWDFAYRAARCGQWEQLARDRVRFQSRIEQMNKVLGPVLNEHHRKHMWQMIHSQMQEIT